MRSLPRQLRRSNLPNCTSCLTSKTSTPARFLSSQPSPFLRPLKRILPKPTQRRQQSTQSRKKDAFPHKTLYLALIIGLGGASWLASQYLQNIAEKPIFDPPRFTPFRIIKREQVSPTSIILTVRPPINKISKTATDPYEKWWKAGTWSVEVKQPQLQIARSYTPLPPREGDKPADLRFLIRREYNGEVSGYLHRLQVGEKLELRGPTTELELDRVTEVLFLAGGTGIAPALQVIHTLFEQRDTEDGKVPNLRVIWANRRREDCIGGGKAKGTPAEANYIVQELEALRRKYPGNLQIEYLVDEEGTILDQKKLSQVTKMLGPVKFEPIHTRIDSRLLVVSGPEGFVNYLAGPKRWEGGKEIQGELGGLIGAMRLRERKVWKL